jgi:hypothetical protein
VTFNPHCFLSRAKFPIYSYLWNFGFGLVYYGFQFREWAVFYRQCLTEAFVYFNRKVYHYITSKVSHYSLMVGFLENESGVPPDSFSKNGRADPLVMFHFFIICLVSFTQ